MPAHPNHAAAAAADAALAQRVDENEATLEHLLAHAHLHVTRYFRSWIPDPHGDELIALLTAETLLRIAGEAEVPGAREQRDVLASWLEAAHGVGVELLRPDKAGLDPHHPRSAQPPRSTPSLGQ